jgi:hypothetical protein
VSGHTRRQIDHRDAGDDARSSDHTADVGHPTKCVGTPIITISAVPTPDQIA